MTLTLLHTADWQIGKQFAAIAGDAGAVLRTQRLETVRALAALASERRVDAVLVAGDVFEDNAVSEETLRRTINALAGFSRPTAVFDQRRKRASEVCSPARACQKGKANHLNISSRQRW